MGRNCFTRGVKFLVCLLAAAALCSCSTLANRRELYSPAKKTYVPAAQPAPLPAA